MRKILQPIIAVVLIQLLLVQHSYGFCGFYVAKADATLFNNKSEVILVRDGNRTVITMSNDFKGDVKDFAMVVPVPVVLKENQIHVVKRNVFDYLDSYSAPRLVEYYDSNPCEIMVEADESYSINYATMSAAPTAELSTKSMYKEVVKIEAQYQIGEYDILLLSATESNGLKDWLIANGYKIPETAAEVLEPYIKSKMKFFVVKVNTAKFKSSGFDYLSPIQISFENERFMLPIRLGMANSQGSQDMIVYAFTRTGRVECTNYRTLKMPTDRNVPLFVKDEFGSFYKSLFDKNWKRESRKAVFLEYAWDVTPNWGMKCDPCVGPPPLQQEFADAGVWWANEPGNNRTFFTRMHIRYEKDKFPSDLTFQVTPNNEQYQARYVLTNPARGSFDCDEGQEYLVSLMNRRQLEVDEYNALVGNWNKKSYAYVHEYAKYQKPTYRKNEAPSPSVWWNGKNLNRKFLISLFLLLTVAGVSILQRRKTLITK